MSMDPQIIGDVRRAVGEIVQSEEVLFEKLTWLANIRDEAKRREASFDLSVTQPGIASVGTVLGFSGEERARFLDLLLLAPNERALLDRLVALFERSTAMQRAFRHVMPVRFSSPALDDWTRYRSWLRGLPDEPIWGDPEGAGIGSIYVAPRYTHGKQVADQGQGLSGIRQTDDTDADLPEEYDLIPRILALMGDDAEAGHLQFVLGGPGVGKSSFLKMLAAHLAEDERWWPVLIRLRDVDPGEPILSEVQRLLSKASKPGFPAMAADLGHQPNLVLLLDGFDELAMATRDSMTRLFFQAKDLARERGGAGLRIVLGGRDTLFRAQDAAFPVHSHLFSLLHFDNEQVDVWSQKWNLSRGTHFDGLRFLEAPKKTRKRKTKEVESGLQHIATLPLMLYMLARMEADGQELDPKAQGASRANVYRKLIEWSCTRHEEDRVQAGKGWNKAQMRRFLRVSGFTAFVKGSDILHRKDLETGLRAAGLAATVEEERFQAERTLLSFAFRVKEDETYWEFTHKSFGEYLAAEHLAVVCHQITERVQDLEFDEETWRLDEAAATRAWIEALGTTFVSAEVEDLLTPMIANWPAFVHGEDPSKGDGWTRLRERLGELYPRLIDEVEAETVQAVSRRWGITPQRVRGYAMANLFVLGGKEERFRPEDAAAGRFMEAYHGFLPVFPKFDEEAARRLTGRISLAGLAHECWKEDAGLTVCLPFIDLCSANLAERGFALALLHEADLSSADLSGADLYGANVFGANLSGANLAGARLLNTVLTDANLADANLSGANLSGANLSGANLSGANLDGADLSGANLEGTRGLSEELRAKWVSDTAGTVLPKRSE